MMTPQSLDELDRLFEATRQEPTWSEESDHYRNIDILTQAIPELTAEVRRLWAELSRGDQVGMVSLLRESRDARCVAS